MAEFKKEFPCPSCGQPIPVQSARQSKASVEMAEGVEHELTVTYVRCIGCNKDVCCQIDNDITLMKLNNIIRDTAKAKKEKRKVVRERLIKDMHLLDRSLDEDRKILAKAYAGRIAYIKDGDKELPIELGVIDVENS